jgi:Pyruvate/2-oxoacid:ferredoxin oxidoreductase gamma subunit
MLKGIKKGGTFLLNSIWDAEETKKRLPARVKRQLAKQAVQFYIINATAIAEEIVLPAVRIPSCSRQSSSVLRLFLMRMPART